MYLILEVQESAARRIDSMKALALRVDKQMKFLENLCKRFSLSKRALKKLSFGQLTSIIRQVNPQMNIVEGVLTELVQRYCNG